MYRKVVLDTKDHIEPIPKLFSWCYLQLYLNTAKKWGQGRVTIKGIVCFERGFEKEYLCVSCETDFDQSYRLVQNEKK